MKVFTECQCHDSLDGNVCDVLTGHCGQCKPQFEGNYCEKCKTGFYGFPTCESK